MSGQFVVIFTSSFSSSHFFRSRTEIQEDDDPRELVAPIVCSIIGGLAFVGLAIIIYNRIRHRSAIRQLEDGLSPHEKPMSKSGRKWLSRVGRFNRLSRGKRRPSDIEVKTPASAVPRYLRTGGRSPVVDRPLPPAPAYPRSARVIGGGNGNNSLMFTIPSDHTANRVSLTPSIADSIRSFDKMDRRKVQIGPQPVIIGHPFSALPPSARAILPPGYTGSEKPPASADITWKIHETQRAVADLEAKRIWHVQHAHPKSARHNPSSCAVDDQIERDIAELTHEVRVLETMLPSAGLVGTPQYATRP